MWCLCVTRWSRGASCGGVCVSLVMWYVCVTGDVVCVCHSMESWGQLRCFKMEPLGRPHLSNTSSLCCGSHDSHPTSREVVMGREGGEGAAGRGGRWRDPSWGEGE